MGHVTIRDLRNKGGEVIERAASGEAITITKAGTPVALLRALPRPGLSAGVLIARWRALPAVDPVRLRSDLDELLDSRV